MSPVPWWGSLRLRIALVVAALVVSVVAVMAVVVDNSVSRIGRDRLADQARHQLTSAITIWEINGRLIPGATRDQSQMPATVTAPLSKPGTRSTWYDGRSTWAAQRLSDHQVLAVSVSGAAFRAERGSLRRTLLIALGGSLVVGAGLGWLAAVGLSRRLRLAARLAGERPETGRSVGTAVGGTDEVAALSAAVDTMATRLEERVEVERRFGADIAHELRTPLTGLVSAAELLPDGVESDLVRSQVGRMRALVIDLLEVFRAEQGVEAVTARPALLSDAVAASVERIAAAGSAPSVTVTVAGASAAMVQVDQRRLDRIVANLVGNADLHGRAPIEVTVAGATLTVRDHGDGFPAALLVDGPQPFRRYTSVPGSGLGLALAARQAAVMGASLRLSNHSGGGAQVSITFASPPPREV